MLCAWKVGIIKLHSKSVSPVLSIHINDIWGGHVNGNLGITHTAQNRVIHVLPIRLPMAQQDKRDVRVRMHYWNGHQTAVWMHMDTKNE